MGTVAVLPPISQPLLGVLFRKPLLAGEQGTAQTVQLMRRLIDEALSDAQFVRQAIDIVRNVPAYDDAGELQALFHWTRQNIRFTKDPLTKEKLYPPRELLKIRAGDCDDMSMLLGAFAIAIGYPARLVTVSANPSHPEEFSHVYVEAELPPGSGQWVAMDAARYDSQFGVEPPAYFRKRAWSLTDDSYQDLQGLGAYGMVRSSDIVRERLAGLGYDDSGGFDWSGFTSQILSETPAIISASTGQRSATQTPYGSFNTGPYSSFATPYTPGYGGAPAGYGLQAASSGIFGAALPWLALGLLGVALFRR